jgi:hypothetical protein
MLAAVQPQNLCAFDAAGQVIVIFDGQEVLVHGGADEAPMWRRDLEGEILGLGAAGDSVVTLEASSGGGKLRFFQMESGDPLDTITVAGEVSALAVARERAVCAVILADGASVLERGRTHRRIALKGASAAAFHDDGDRLALGSDAGEVKIFGLSHPPAPAVGTSKLDGCVTSLCWSPAGFWIATCGDRVVRIPPEGGAFEHITRAKGMTPDCVCASNDGTMIAVRLTPDLMMAMAYPSRETVVQLDYVERQITGVCFGGGRLLGVGLAGGDGNVVDIPGKQLRRTDTFEGRKHNRWLVKVVIEPEHLPPEAPRKRAARPASPAAASIAAPPDGRSPGMLIGIALAVLIVVVLVLTRLL